MKYTVEITRDKMVEKFIDDNGHEYVNTWVEKDSEPIQTLEPPMENQMLRIGKFNNELLDAIASENLDDIWKIIRNS